MAKRRKAAAESVSIEGPSRPEKSAWALYALAAFLGVLLFFRPLIDGIVFAQYNGYFVWGATLFAAAWGGRALLRGEGVSVGLGGWLLLGFAVVAAVSARSSISMDETNHALPIWASYVLLYVAARNLCRDGRARSMCLAFFGAGLAAECIYSLFHLAHVLPMMRMRVNSDPGAVAAYFGGADITEDIRHRLESNRAFGSFMFPNALAAYVVLGIPWGIAGTLTAWPALKAAMARKPFGEKPVMTPIPAALVYLIAPAFGAMVLFQVALFLVQYVEESAASRGSLLANGGVQTLLIYFMPLFVAGAPAVLVWRFGFAGAGLILRAALFPILTVLCGLVLWFTASRGGMLGTAAALGLWAALSLGRSRIPSAWLRRAAAASAILVMAPMLFAHGQEEAPPPQAAVDIEGRETTISDLANVSTMQLRVHYWKVGAAMAADHLGSGVGLGNFANAYPYYRYEGAPFVQMAHNDFLQMFAETGAAGGVLFAAFWLVFIAAGVVRIVGIEDRTERMTAAGLFFGVVAFAMHQLVDFGFQNPSLGFTVFCLAGAALAPQSPQAAVRGRTWLLAAFLCLSALTAGAASRIHMADARLAELGPTSANLEAAVTLLTAGAGPGGAEANAVYLSAASVTSLVHNSIELESMGYFAVPRGGGESAATSFVRIPTTPILEPGTVFVIEKPDQARPIGRAAVQRWIERAVKADESYPYRWRLAFDLFQMHEVLANTAGAGPAKDAAIAGAEHWARIFIERNRYNGFAHFTLAKALWMRGEAAEAQSLGSGEAAFRSALDALSQATQFNPSEPQLWGAYGQYAFQLCGMLENRGEQAKGAQMFQLARNAWLRQGELLWIHSRIAPARQQERDRLAALLAWRSALQRDADKPESWRNFAKRLDEYAGLVEWLDRPEDAAEYRRQANESRERAMAIENGTLGSAGPQTR